MYYKKFDFGDVSVHFAEIPLGGKKTTAGMAVLPKAVEVDPKQLRLGALVQAAFSGDEPRYTSPLGNFRAIRPLKIARQVMFVNGDLNTYLTDESGGEFVHRLKYERSTGVFSLTVRYENKSGETKTLEWLSSFSFGGFSCFQNLKDISLCRIAGAEQLFRRQCEGVSSLGLSREGVSLSWGGVGGCPSKKFYPFAALKTENAVLGVSLEAPFSWKFELLNLRGDLVFSGGISDFETGHFSRVVPPSDSFETPRASFTLQRSEDEVYRALLEDLERRLPVPKCEEDLPIVYLDGGEKRSAVTPAKVNRALKMLPELCVGVYMLPYASKKNFQDGFEPVVRKIGEAGMRAGLYLNGDGETEETDESLFLKRDGKQISAGGKFPDLRTEKLREQLLQHVLEVKKSGFEYVGVSSGMDFGFGCDSFDRAALGEGGRRVAVEGVRFLEQFTKCAAVALFSPLGSKIEPYRAGKIDLSALSNDEFLPLAAANLSRVLSARRILLPLAVEKDMAQEKLEFVIVTAMLGRVCLSGDVSALPPEGMELLRRGLGFYIDVADVIKGGKTVLIDNTVEDGDFEKGRQIVIRESRGRRLILVHFYGAEGALRIPIAGYTLKNAFCSLSYAVRGDVLRIVGEAHRACAFYLEASAQNGGER